jgi:hypothetical protein
MAKVDEDNEVQRAVLLVALLTLALSLSLIIALLHAIISGDMDVVDSFSMLSSMGIWVMGFFAGFFSVIFFIMFMGLLYRQGWGRVMVMIFGLPGVVIFAFKSIISVSFIESQVRDNVAVDASEYLVLASSIGLIAVSLLSIWYMGKPDIILAFEAQEVELTKRKIAGLERRIRWGKEQCNAGKMSKAELAKLKAECLAKEKVLRGRIRHLDKVRLARERKQKETEDRAVERWEDRQAKKEKKKAEREERKAQKELEKEEKGEETGEKKGEPPEAEENKGNISQPKS